MTTPRPGLIAAREKAGLSQRELAERTGLGTRVRISQYERGLKVPSVDLAMRFAAVLGVPVETLFSTTPGSEPGRSGVEETSPSDLPTETS